MKPIKLSMAVEMLETVSDDTRVYYNTQTGEYGLDGDYIEHEDGEDEDKYEGDEWIAGPHQYDIREYEMMEDFIESVENPHKSDILSVAIQGRGAFRRFKDTVSYVGLDDALYKYRDAAYKLKAIEWCTDNDLPYVDDVISK